MIKYSAFEEVQGIEEEAHEGQPLDAMEMARRMLSGRSREEQLILAGALVAKHAKSVISIDAPQTPDELWDYINDTWSIKIARVSVCEDHDAPFDFVCAGFFELYPNIFEIGPRGGGKSFKTAMILQLNSRFKPGCESVVFGAVDEQSKKVYDDMRDIFLNGGLPEGEIETVGEPTMTATIHKNGSKVTCFPGTVAKVNGPHPPKVHSEEVEIMKAPVWKESRNLAADKILPKEGRRIKAQNYGTSTMKYKKGRVEAIRNAFLDAKARAKELLGPDASKEVVDDLITKTAPFYVFIHCIFEVAEQVPNCRRALENEDLPEWGTAGVPLESCKCDCHMIESGRWDDGSMRTLDQICVGKFHRSRGHRSRHEVIQLFIQNDRHTWQAQQECRETESEGLYIKAFSRTRHGLSAFTIDPANGPIYTGTDWGFTNEAVVLWVQYLMRSVEAVDYDGKVKTLHKGSRVVFSEIYEAGLTATELGQKAIVREVALAKHVSGLGRMRARRRWADLAGAGDRKDWKKMGLKTYKYSTRVFEEHVKEVRGMFEFDRAFVVIDKDDRDVLGCPNYADEMEAWREEDGKEVDQFNHAMAAGRYVFYGMHDIYDDAGALGPDGELPKKLHADDGDTEAPGVQTREGRFTMAEREEQQGAIDDESWRAALGVGADQV